MTATRTFISVAEGAAASDMQRISDAAARADDRAHEVIFTPGISGTQKRVVPLANDTSTSLARLLVVPGTAAGTVQVMPARFIAGVAPYTIAAAISSLAAVQSPVLASNPGAIRTDLVYARLAVTPTTATRKFKDQTSGVVGTAPTTVYETPVLTVNIAQGNALDGAPGALPADTTGVYNFPLANVTLPGAYVNTSPITQTMIAQQYERGWIPPQRVQTMRPMSIFNSASPYKSGPTQLADVSRWGSISVFYGGWKHTTASQPAVVLDSSIDWRRRLIWGQAIYYGGTAPDAMAASMTVGIQIAGTDFSTAMVANAVPMCIFGPSGGGGEVFYASPANGWTLSVNASGVLSVTIAATSGPYNPATGDFYGIVLFVSDQFVF